MKYKTAFLTLIAGVVTLTYTLSSCATPPVAQKKASTNTQGNAYGVSQASTGKPNGAYPTSPSTPYPAATASVPAYVPPPASSPNLSMSNESYVVKKGDTLWSISQKHNTSVQALQSANSINDTTIKIGQTLDLPQ